MQYKNASRGRQRLGLLHKVSELDTYTSLATLERPPPMLAKLQYHGETSEVTYAAIDERTSCGTAALLTLR